MPTSLTAQDIAALCGGETVSHASISAVSSPVKATSVSLVFAEDALSLAEALQSSAGLILAPLTLAVQETGAGSQDVRIIHVRSPRYAFALCARALRPKPSATEVHPTACVAPTASLGPGTRIGAGAVVEAGAVLGENVVLGSLVTICHGVRLGDRVIVQAGTVLGAEGFGYVRDPSSGAYLQFPQMGDLVIEDDVEIGANVTIDRGALSETRIGRGTKIDNLVHIGHNCRIGQNVIIAAQVGISGSSIVEDGAMLAGQVGISDHCRIGPGVILGGQAGVYRGKAVEGVGQVFAGTPAEPLKDHMRGLARLRRLS